MTEPVLRGLGFIGAFVVMGLWEFLAPRRAQGLSRRIRWPANLGIALLNTILTRILFPAAAVGGAIWAQGSGWGLFNRIPTPGWIAVIASVTLLDVAVYAQHVVLHYVPLLWRLHRVHHADVDLDVTSGVRFHPLEILLSLVFKLVVVISLGAPAVAVFAFEMALNLSAMFNHANVRLWPWLDRGLRLVIITPDAHRVHHSIRPDETNSNFGFTISLWDRLFRTWRDQPRDGHEGMTIGLREFRAVKEQRVDQLLLQPFRRHAPIEL